jgi:death-on-curing protein
VFLDLNEHATDLDDDAAFTLVMDVAAGTVDVEHIAVRLRITPR